MTPPVQLELDFAVHEERSELTQWELEADGVDNTSSVVILADFAAKRRQDEERAKWLIDARRQGEIYRSILQSVQHITDDREAM